MLNLYLVITPIFGFLSLMSLLNLKLMLAQPKSKDLWKYEPKVSKKQIKDQQKNDVQKEAIQSSYKKTLFYLLKNFTIVEFCFVRRSRNRILFLLTISCIAIISIFVSSYLVYVSSFSGIVIAFFYLLVKILGDQSEESLRAGTGKGLLNKSKLNEVESGQRLQIILTCASLLANLVVIWLIYHNSNNQQILIKTFTFLSNIAVDNLIIRFLFFSMLAFPLKFSSSFNEFVNKQTEILAILQGQRVLKQKFKTQKMGRRKIHNQTSNTQNTLQIEPCVNFQLDKHNFGLQNIQNPPIQQKGLSINSMQNEQKNQQSQSSLGNFLSYAFKHNDEVITSKKTDKIDKTQSKSNQNIEADSDFLRNSSFIRKRNKLYVSKISSFLEKQIKLGNSQRQVQNEEDFQVNQKQNKPGYFSAKKQCQVENKETTNVRTYLQMDSLDKNRQKSRPILNNEQASCTLISGFNYSVKTDLLKIRQDKCGQDLQQIDMNSPQRRRNQFLQMKFLKKDQRKMSLNQENAKFKQRLDKIHKKFSLDPRRHDVQQSLNLQMPELKISDTMMPYLDNQLQKSHKKETANRNSELGLSRKSDVFTRFSNDSRIKSVKRARNTKDPIVRQNNENQIPEFIIEDFIC